jgi:hypothetical protein
MSCPTCNAPNDAMAVRCLSCGSTLIFEATGHSEGYNKAARQLDYRMYTGYGGIAGLMLAMLLAALSPEIDEHSGKFLGGLSAVGAGLGRFIAWRRWREPGRP